MLQVKDLTFSYEKKQTQKNTENESNIIKNVSFQVKQGEFVGLIGQNGSGKSTLLKTIYRGLLPDSGSIRMENQDLLTMSYKESAKKMAVVGQENELHFDFTVEEIVAMGRSPYKKFFDIDNEQDKEIVKEALHRFGILDMKQRSYLSLSGGEKQRVLLARAIAQEAKFLILDEPTNHLDIRYQMQIFELLKSLNSTVLAAVHDLNLAALFCDRLLVMKDGELVLEGKPEEILTTDNIFHVFGVNSYVEINKMTGKLSITYLTGTNK